MRSTSSLALRSASLRSITTSCQMLFYTMRTHIITLHYAAIIYLPPKINPCHPGKADINKFFRSAFHGAGGKTVNDLVTEECVYDNSRDDRNNDCREHLIVTGLVGRDELCQGDRKGLLICV